MTQNSTVSEGGSVEIGLDATSQGAKVPADMVPKKSKANHKQKSDLRANLMKLADACPFHLDNPEDCQLFELRKLKPAARVQWVNALSEADLAYLNTYHRVCLRIKTKSGSAKSRTKAPANRGSLRKTSHRRGLAS